MSLRRQLNSDGIAHANADSATHARHVRQRKGQRTLEWIPETAPETSPSEVFKLRAEGLNLTNGIYFTGAGTKESEVPGQEFEKHLSSINWERRWNYAQMKRGAKVCRVKRKRKEPAVGETVVNLSPWQMLFINKELDVWKNAGVSNDKRREMLLAWLQPLRRSVMEEFQNTTGWEGLGSYIHLDSNKIHFGVIHSRVSESNELIGDKYLKTAGPWSTAMWRVKQVGAADSADSRLRQNLEKFAARHGEKTVPLDIRLHSVVDTKFDELVSYMEADAKKRFEVAKEEYREWKTKVRRDSLVRSPGSQRIAWDVLRLVNPLFPPPIQATIRLARTAYQAFQVVTAALDAVSSDSQSQPVKTREIEKIL